MKILLSLVFILILSMNLNASYSDFLKFAVEEKRYQNKEVDLEPIYEKFLGGLSPWKNPFLIAVGGSSGAGKTTYRKTFLKIENVHIQDMDEVMIALPCYQKDLKKLGAKEAFEKWWPTAQKISQLLVQYAIRSNFSIIYDRTCGTEGSYFDLREAKEKGYYVRLIGFYIDESIARNRIKERELKENRAVTEQILKEYRARFSALWPYYLNIADEISLNLMDSKTPKIIFSSKKGVLNQNLYEDFLKEGDSFFSYFANKIQDRDKVDLSF